MMTCRVEAYIVKHRLLRRDELTLVTLSGGADSVSLLRVLHELGYPIEALHCNFHLRGEESDRDEAFAATLCKRLGITLHTQHFHTASYAAQRRISMEMAAREQRYTWFRQMMKERGAQAIAVAHHQDDQAETLLLNLIRGTGLRGLAAMKPRHDGIVRPLLCVSRNEILQYLHDIGQDYVVDSTNLERDATRNKLRLDVLPLLRQINPSLTHTLNEAARIVRHSLPFYAKGVEAAMAEQGITPSTFPTAALSRGADGSVLLYEWLRDKGFTASQQHEMAEATSSGRLWQSPSHQVLRDREALLLRERGWRPAPIQLIQKTVTHIGDTGPDVAYFDADLLTQPIVVRPVREGDSFVPFGMKGRKLVSDFLTDQKRTLFQKEEQQVATCGEEIIWVIGLRSDNRYRVTPRTQHILKLETLRP